MSDIHLPNYQTTNRLARVPKAHKRLCDLARSKHVQISHNVNVAKLERKHRAKVGLPEENMITLWRDAIARSSQEVRKSHLASPRKLVVGREKLSGFSSKVEPQTSQGQKWSTAGQNTSSQD
jgi:hypothetical protein